MPATLAEADEFFGMMNARYVVDATGKPTTCAMLDESRYLFEAVQFERGGNKNAG